MVAVRDTDGRTGVESLLNSVTVEFIAMDMQHVVTPRAQGIAELGRCGRKPHHAKALGYPRFMVTVINRTSGGESLALIVATLTRLSAKDEIHLKVGMVLTDDVHKPGLDAAAIQAAN
jgi:hypothetical protein